MNAGKKNKAQLVWCELYVMQDLPPPPPKKNKGGEGGGGGEPRGPFHVLAATDVHARKKKEEHKYSRERER